MKIKDLPSDLRPREKAIKFGIDTLSDAELIAIILRNGTKNSNVVQLASDVLATVGGLGGLVDCSYQSLKKIPGIKDAKALSLASIITIYQRVDMSSREYQDYSINDILNKYQKRLHSDKQEKLILIVLNRDKVIVKESIIGIGTDSSVAISYREIFKEIYLNNGYGFYLIHTHPNAISFPSDSDIAKTKVLIERSKKLSIHFYEHYVIGTDGVTGISQFLKPKEKP